MLGPLFSGPKDQIFKVSFLSQLKGSSIKFLDLSFGSSLEEIFPASMASDNSFPNGTALTKSLLCLFGDLAKQT